MRSRTADPSRLCQPFKLTGRRDSLVSASLIKPVMNRAGPVMNRFMPVMSGVIAVNGPMTPVKVWVGDPKISGPCDETRSSQFVSRQKEVAQGTIPISGGSAEFSRQSQRVSRPSLMIPGLGKMMGNGLA